MSAWQKLKLLKYKILIADDDKLIQTLISEILINSKNHYQIVIASDGEVAYQLTIKEQPDLILLDWQMPILNGIETLKLIKNNVNTKDIPVIMQTGMAESKNLQEALDAGAMDYIKKPIDNIELLARVKSALLLYESIRQIRQQKLRIEEQMEELNRLSLIVKQTDNAVILANSKFEIEWVNEAFKKLYGYDLVDFKKKFGRTILEASSYPDIKTKITQIKESKKSLNYIASCKTKYGAIKWVQTNLTPLFDGNRIEKYIAIETDISTQKEAEFMLKVQNEEMQGLMQHLEKANSLLERQNQEIVKQKQEIEAERQKSDNLILNVLPLHVAQQLKAIGYAKPRNYNRVTVMFTDFQGFTNSCKSLTPEEVVSTLHEFFCEFDDVISKRFIEKIKTIGDAYMCAGGVPLRNRSNPIDVVLAGLEIQHFMKNFFRNEKHKKLPKWNLRIGIHTGPLTAGVVGKIKFAYDIWGDTVNIAQRMETACEPEKVNVSGATYEQIKEYFDCEYRGEIEMKNRGIMNMYFVIGLKEEFATDETRIYPNENFLNLLNSL